MAKVLHEIDAGLAAWIAAQPLFFVATAPLAADGHVNLSPRGLDTFRIIGPHEVVWLDLTGSGNETAAHVQVNPRMTFMFCACEGDPLILRLYGKARAIHHNDAEWPELAALFPPLPGARGSAGSL